MNFDPNVKVGQIRVFADTREPFVALILEDRGLVGFRLVPVSPYRVPASEAELSVGERVFQLWNACTAARRFVERSWTVDTLPDEDIRRLSEGVAAARLTKLGDYERRHLAVGGDFQPWASKFPQKRSVTWWRTGAWSAAAMIVLGIGVAWLVGRDAAEERGTRVMALRMERPPTVETLSADDTEPRPSAGPLPEVAVNVAVETPSVVSPESAPEVRSLAQTPKMTSAAMSAQVKPLDKDAVVAARPRAGVREAEVVKALRGLKQTQRADGSWGGRTQRDTALAVLALMAHGETSDSAEYGPTLVKGVRYLTETSMTGGARQDRQIAACALCCASVAVRNPNVRVAAERLLASLGDNRSVEAGRDWRGILNDLSPSVQTTKSQDFRVTDDRLVEDPVAADSILVLQLLR